MDIQKERACCFTGHRQIPESERDALSLLLRKYIRAAAERGYTDFICGGALGFDTMAAVTVINLKREYEDIRLFIAVPHAGQSDKWSFSAQALYNDILKKADGYTVLSDKYTPYCMSVRNRFMVDNASLCFAYLTTEGGGTFGTVKYAERMGVRVVNLARYL